MRVADAYERETPWRSMRPTLTPGAGPLPLPPVPDPEPADCSPAERDRIAMICKKAGLVLNERVFEQLCASAPYVEAMTASLHGGLVWSEEPSTIFAP
jgi:hypothetical protein